MPAPELPLSARWIPLFVESIDTAMLGELTSWQIEGRTDPLHLVLSLQLRHNWTKLEVNLVRSMLKTWAEANDATYRRSEYKKGSMKALIILKGLGPVRAINPYLE